MGIASELEKTIAQHRFHGLQEQFQGSGFVMPFYGGLSIANLGATVAGLLGMELEGAEPPVPRNIWGDLVGGVRTVVLVLLDGVGYAQLLPLLQDGDRPFGRLASRGKVAPLTSVFPSTTLTAMTSLWTGRTPGDHGFLGSHLLLSEFGVLANMLKLAPAAGGMPGELLQWGLAPDRFVSVPNVAQTLSAAGVRTAAHLYGPHVGSGLARILLRGVDRMVGHVGFSDMWANVQETVAQRTSQPLFVKVYWFGTDDVAHAYGPNGERSRAALRDLGRSMQEDFIDRLPGSAREGTVLIVTADHGQIATPEGSAVRLLDHPALRRMLLIPPAGEKRASYLYALPGHAEDVADYVGEHLADRFLLLETEAALSAGLFGSSEVSPLLRGRLGDFLLLARGDGSLVPAGEKAAYRGHHGSLTPEEMLVPLVMARLDG